MTQPESVRVIVRYGRSWFSDDTPMIYGQRTKQTDSNVWLAQNALDLATLIDHADQTTEARSIKDKQNRTWTDADTDRAQAAVRVIITARKAAADAGIDLKGITPRPRPDADISELSAAELLLLLPFERTPLLDAYAEALKLCDRIETTAALPASITKQIPTTSLAEALSKAWPQVALFAVHQAHLINDLARRSQSSYVAALSASAGNLAEACQKFHRLLTQEVADA